MKPKDLYDNNNNIIISWLETKINGMHIIEDGMRRIKIKLHKDGLNLGKLINNNRFIITIKSLKDWEESVLNVDLQILEHYKSIISMVEGIKNEKLKVKVYIENYSIYLMKNYIPNINVYVLTVNGLRDMKILSMGITLNISKEIVISR